MNLKKFFNNSAPLDSKESQLTLVAMIMMLYVMALFLGVAIHEILGHGLVSLFFGGQVYAVYLSPGSGYVSFYLPETVSVSQAAFIYLAGIIVQILVGIVILLLIFPRIKNFFLGLFTLLFCVALLVHSSIYLFLGYYFESGDTRYAVYLLEIQPGSLIVAGLILTGVFVVLISMAALNFIGSFMNVRDEKVRIRLLLMFWLPPLVMSSVSALTSWIYTPIDDMTYIIVNATITLLFMGMAIFLVPVYVEPERTRKYKIRLQDIFAVMLVFIIIMGVWIGGFGYSQDTAHGVLLYDPPLEVENYYSDVTIGNLEMMVYSNGTARIDIILRHTVDDSSPLNEKIYHTFDDRPNWENYIDRSRNMAITMFDLPREIGENLTFSTGFGTARALGIEDENGRVCTTYIKFWENGTRQVKQPGTGEPLDDYRIEFTDPWHNRGGYLDEVRISWAEDIRLDGAFGLDGNLETISYNRGSMENRSIGWKNIDNADSPVTYVAIFTDPYIIPEAR